MDRKDLVSRGYDKVSYAYRDSEVAEGMPDYEGWLDELTPLLPRPSCILDMGCGCGIPVAKRLSKTFDVTGIDISPVQIRRARALVPKAKFVCADMGVIDFPADTFEAIVCLYAIIHVPVEEQQPLFPRMAKWLRPGGLLLATVGNLAWTGTAENWLGVAGATMYWSHADEKTYLGWLEEAGFDIRSKKFVAEGDFGHTLVLARSRR